MNRRGFFSALAGAAAGVIVGPELAELLVPKRTIFLPPAGGWIGGNRLVSLDELSREMVSMMDQVIEASKRIDHDYDVAFIDGDLWRFGPVTTEVFTRRPFEFNRIDVKRPPRYR